MLNELYKYAVEHDLSSEPGFAPKQIKGYLMLSKDGQFLGIDPSAQKDVVCPDVGPLANGSKFCNILVEKAFIPLNIPFEAEKDIGKNKNIPLKRSFYLSALENGSSIDPLFSILLSALTNETTLQEMRDALMASKIKPTDPIGFQIDGIPMEKSPDYRKWWKDFLEKQAPAAEKGLSRCLITGELSEAVSTVNKVKGLMFVGGHTAGDAFLCFDKDAFQSYGLKQGDNAPVSESAMAAVNESLRTLISNAPVFGGTKMVHWYSGSVPDEIDIIPVLFDLGLESQEMEEEPQEDSSERRALSSARKLLESYASGEIPEMPEASYYIMPLSGMSGRMMVRGWYTGSFDSLCKNICLWFDDLRITIPFGNALTRPPKLKALCVRLLKPGGDAAKVFQRMDDELSNLLNRIFYAIVNGSALPDEVASRTLHWLRSLVYESSNDTDKKPSKFDSESLCYELLKVWLIRKNRLKEGESSMGPEMNPEYPGVAYHCGRLMAVYAAVQADAMGPNLGTGVLQRYFASASTAPNLVLGRLSALSQHHLAKLENQGAVIRYNKMLSEISCAIGTRKIPTNFSLEQQTEFSLGYYQQRVAIYTKSAKDESSEEYGSES